jgi:branched-chain amino acid transport system substrate-binding protein
MVLVLSLVLAACGTTPAGVVPQTGGLPASIKIGVDVPLTGRYADGGDEVKNGYVLAMEDINKAGGVKIMGKQIPLELVIRDDASDPTKAVQNMESLNSDEHVVAYLGGFGSDIHAAASAIAEKNKIPYIGVAFSLFKIHQQGFQYLFSPFPKSQDFAKAIFDLFDTLNPKPLKLALFIEKTDWGAELGADWQKEAQARGYQIVTNETYTPLSNDFSSLIIKAKNAGAQAVLALPNPPDAITMTKQMKELDFSPQVISYVRGTDSVAWPKSMGKDGNYIVLPAGGSPQANFPGALDMFKRHLARFGKPAAGTTAPAYAAVQILVDAIQRANSLDPKAIRNALAATNMTTVAGPVTFNPDGTGKVITVVSQYQNGQQQLIWPKSLAVTSIIYPMPAWNKR